MSAYKDKIFGFYQSHKRMPSYAEIMKLVGFKSKNAVYKLINKLVGEEKSKGIDNSDNQKLMKSIKHCRKEPNLKSPKTAVKTHRRI